MSQYHPPGHLKEGALNSTLTLAPLPVDTNAKAVDGRGLISYKDEAVLELGGNETNMAMSYQVLISILNGFNACIFICFLVCMGYAIHWGGGYLGATITCLIFLALLYSLVLGGWIWGGIKAKRAWPIRFHRQRREVAIAANVADPKTGKKKQRYFYAPWEDIHVALHQGKQVATTGVTESFSLHFAFTDPETGLNVRAEYSLGSAVIVMGLWECIRVFMDKGPDACPQDWFTRQNVQKKGFMAMTLEGYRALCRENKNQYKLQWITAWEYYYDFCFKQWCQGGTIPYRLSDRYHRNAGMNRKPLPPADTEWGKPIPQSQWVAPSRELQEINAFLDKTYAPGGVDFMTAMEKWQKHNRKKTDVTENA